MNLDKLKQFFYKNYKIVLFCLFVIFFNTLTMPAEIYSGDPTVIRAIANFWVVEGEWGIPYSWKPGISPNLYAKKNNFYVENDRDEKLYSRWGEMNTLLFAIPEIARGAS